MTTRRDFLRLSCAAAPFAAAFPSVFARALASAPPGDRVVVLLRLGGGNDGLNTVVPAEDDRYHRARPSLRIPKEAALPVGDRFLHPALEGLRGLFDDGRVAIVEGVGYPSPDRSHFRSTDIWHTARPEREERRTGWIARAVDARPGDPLAVPAIAVLDDESPLALVGGARPAPTIPALDDVLLDDPALGAVAREASAIDATAPAPLRHVRAATRTAVETADRLSRVAADARTDAFPPSRLGRRLATVNALLRAGLGTRFFYTALDGFDTHTRQEQNHAQLLRDLDRSITAWSDDLRRTGDDRRVLLVTFSEFGRRVAENASLGTDHGAAAPLFAVSGGLRPGVIGPRPDLEHLDDGDVRHAIDFRRVYATLMERWLEVPAEPVLEGRFDPLEIT